MFFRRQGLGLAATFFFMASMASADVIISNAPGSTRIGDGAIVGLATRSFAQGFTMGSTAYTLDSITLGLRVNNAGRSFDLELYEGSPQPTGSALTTFTVPVLNTTGDALYTFTPNLGLTLQANTTYWIVAYSMTTGTANQIQWLRSSPGVAPTGAGATYAGARFNNPAVVPPTGASALPSIFEVNGTPIVSAVPEPTATALSVLAFATVLRFRRKNV